MSEADCDPVGSCLNTLTGALAGLVRPTKKAGAEELVINGKTADLARIGRRSSFKALSMRVSMPGEHCELPLEQLRPIGDGDCFEHATLKN